MKFFPTITHITQAWNTPWPSGEHQFTQTKLHLWTYSSAQFSLHCVPPQTQNKGWRPLIFCVWHLWRPWGTTLRYRVKTSWGGHWSDTVYYSWRVPLPSCVLTLWASQSPLWVLQVTQVADIKEDILDSERSQKKKKNQEKLWRASHQNSPKRHSKKERLQKKTYLSSDMGSPRATGLRGIEVSSVEGSETVLHQLMLLCSGFFTITWGADVSSSWVQMCQRNHGFKLVRTSVDMWAHTQCRLAYLASIIIK